MTRTQTISKLTREVERLSNKAMTARNGSGDQDALLKALTAAVEALKKFIDANGTDDEQKDDKQEKLAAKLARSGLRERVDRLERAAKGDTKAAEAAEALNKVKALHDASLGDAEAKRRGEEMDRKAGIRGPSARAIEHDGTRLRLGVMTPAEARAYAAKKGGLR